MFVQLVNCCRSLAKLCPTLFPKFSCPSVSPGVCSNSCPASQCCHPAISFSVTPFSSCLQSFPTSGSFPVSWLFPSGGQSIGPSTSASVFPMNIQGRFPLELTGLISLLSKGLSRVFSSTTVLHCSVKLLVKMKIMGFFNMYYLCIWLHQVSVEARGI